LHKNVCPDNVTFRSHTLLFDDVHIYSLSWENVHVSHSFSLSLY
jgi:hypothetical protein